jgi:hypothetical protein
VQGARDASGFSLTVRTKGDVEPIRRALADTLVRVDAGIVFSFREYADQIGASPRDSASACGS